MYDKIGQMRVDFVKANGFYPKYLIVSSNNYHKIRSDFKVQSYFNRDDICITTFMGMRICVISEAPNEFMDMAGSRK